MPQHHRLLAVLISVVGLAFAGPPLAASEGSDQFAKLLDRRISLALDDVTIERAFRAIIQRGHPWDDLPLLNAPDIDVDPAVRERLIDLTVTELPIRDAFAALAKASGDEVRVDWVERSGRITLLPSERIQREQRERREQRTQARNDWLKAQAAAVRTAERLVVHRLGDLVERADPGFPIPHFGQQAVVTGRIERQGDAARPLLEALAGILVDPPEFQIMCHEPAWGVEVFAQDGTRRFRTSLCFKCHNYVIEREGGSEVVTMAGDEKRLKALLVEALP